jgi:hypothetical protein
MGVIPDPFVCSGPVDYNNSALYETKWQCCRCTAEGIPKLAKPLPNTLKFGEVCKEHDKERCEKCTIVGKDGYLQCPQLERLAGRRPPL